MRHNRRSMQQHSTSAARPFPLMIAAALALAIASAACSADTTPVAASTTLGPNCTKYLAGCCQGIVTKAGQPTTSCDQTKAGYSQSQTIADAAEQACASAVSAGKAQNISGC